MSTYTTLDCDGEIVDPVCDPCADIERGRIRNFALVKSSYTFSDTTDSAEWLTMLQAKDGFMFPESSGELAEPTPIKSPGFGSVPEQVTGFDFKATVMIPIYKENAGFVNSIIGRRNFKFVYNTSTQTHITDVPVTIVPLTSIPDDLDGIVTWKFEITWRYSQYPVPFDTPSGVFDKCVEY